MPIKPENKHRYPADWNAIALAVKTAADWKCQGCGVQCRRPGDPFTTHRLTLTVAHYPDHSPENCTPGNLRPLCAPCHLRLDAQHHAQTARATRHGKAGLTDLFSA